MLIFGAMLAELFSFTGIKQHNMLLLLVWKGQSTIPLYNICTSPCYTLQGEFIIDISLSCQAVFSMLLLTSSFVFLRLLIFQLLASISQTAFSVQKYCWMLTRLLLATKNLLLYPFHQKLSDEPEEKNYCSICSNSSLAGCNKHLVLTSLCLWSEKSIDLKIAGAH